MLGIHSFWLWTVQYNCPSNQHIVPRYVDLWTFAYFKMASTTQFSFYHGDFKAESQRLAATISTSQPTISQSSTRRSIVSKSEKKTPLSPKFHLGILISAYCVDYFVPFDSTRTDCLWYSGQSQIWQVPWLGTLLFLSIGSPFGRTTQIPSPLQDETGV